MMAVLRSKEDSSVGCAGHLCTWSWLCSPSLEAQSVTVCVLELCSCDCGERCPLTLFTKSSVAMVAILLEAK